MSFHHKRKPFPENVTPIVVPPPVPKPKPIQPITSVGYTFCGWETPRSEYNAVPGVQCPADLPWKALQTHDREPALGYYNEAEPWVTDARLKQCEFGKIGCVAYQVEWAHEHTQPAMMPAYRPKLPSPLINSHCIDNHPQSSPIKHFASWWDTSLWDSLWDEMKSNGWSSAEALESNRRFAREISKYMTRPNYLHVDGKPVLMRGAADNLARYQTMFHIDPADIVKVWRDEIKKQIGTDIYLIAVSVAPPARPNLKAWDFNALTEYLLHGDGWENTMGVYRWWWAKDLKECREQNLDYWIPATVGYDSKAWGSPVTASHQPTPAQFTEHIKEVRRLVEANYDCTRGFYCIYAMTEFGEGGILEAMAKGMLHDGTEMLKAHAAAL